MMILPALAQAGGFPERGETLRIVVPFAAGGGVDNAARLLGEQLRKQLGLTVIVDNKAGASGSIGGNAVKTAPADGYTLLFSAATHVLAKQVLTKSPYDPQTDFEPVARVGEAPLMLVIPPAKPQKNLADVLAAARQQPEKWTAAIPAAGAPSHLATLLLAKQGDVKFTFVPYKGTQPALVDVGGGHVDLLLDSMIALQQLAKSGKVKAIAITSAKRSALAPDVPTVSESGIANFSYVSWYGVWAPKGTPPERIAVLNKAINAAVGELGKSGAYASLGIEPVSETPEQFKRYVAADVTQGAGLLKNSGFKPE
ncbi:tripartite tricarboxylate transporter substrate binding protein [Piscinibacter sp. XHJ-5]|uniref:Bug family tripartite tricarboxylate transporter substrate binding protein n=1 Tax=Piscinibacter sp. XHJ-5 TaxID=3037797 RepID=UPI002453586F|nr:tripartite tricarboxylate transporter substrate binding protein [Piscinibacter sp. XHJ-5]